MIGIVYPTVPGCSTEYSTRSNIKGGPCAKVLRIVFVSKSRTSSNFKAIWLEPTVNTVTFTFFKKGLATKPTKLSNGQLVF